MRFIEVILILFVGFSLVVSGCDGAPQAQGAIAEGINFNFEEGYPDSILTEGENFNVNIEVLNSLSSPVPFSLCLFGDRSDYYGGVPVQGICKDGLTVDQSYKNNQGVIYPSNVDVIFPSAGESFSYVNLDKTVSFANLRANLKYALKTESSVDVCVLSGREYESTGDFECLPEETFFGQDISQESAPLIVSKVEKSVRSIGGQPQMKVFITLNKASNGEIVQKDDQDLNLVGLTVFLRGTDSDFVCKNQRSEGVVFREGDSIECRADLNLGGNENVYKDSLVIGLSYEYMLEKIKRVTFDKGWEE